MEKEKKTNYTIRRIIGVIILMLISWVSIALLRFVCSFVSPLVMGLSTSIIILIIGIKGE